jgi:hypothetical protein
VREKDRRSRYQTPFYKKMKQNIENSGIKEELAKTVFNPLRLQKLCENYMIEFEEIVEIY